MHLAGTASVVTDNGVELFMKYFICKQKLAGVWSVLVEKREMNGGKVAVTELAYASCGQMRRTAVFALARLLADNAVTPLSLEEIVCDMCRKPGQEPFAPTVPKSEAYGRRA